jgi:hypothetical protein
MGRQTNFYAAPADTAQIHQWLLAEFPGLTIVSQRRGPRQHTVPIDASVPRAFWHYPVSLLIPVWAKPLLIIEDLSPEFPDQFRLSCHSSPVIEYAPCHWDEASQTVTSSRFYWAYSGQLPPESTRQINQLLRWVQRNTVPVKGPFFRFFPQAAQTARFAREHSNYRPKPNPLYQEPPG